MGGRHGTPKGTINLISSRATPDAGLTELSLIVSFLFGLSAPCRKIAIASVEMYQFSSSTIQRRGMLLATRRKVPLRAMKGSQRHGRRTLGNRFRGLVVVAVVSVVGRQLHRRCERRDIQSQPKEKNRNKTRRK